MENLNQYMKNNQLNKNEEVRLDNVVLKGIKPKKSTGLGIFYKFAATLIVFIMIGFGIFLLPQDHQKKVVKPVSAMEVLEKTQQNLKELLEKPGVLHYRYNINTAGDFEEYDNFEVEVYVSNQEKKYLIHYDVSKSELTQPTEIIPGKTYRDFSPQNFAIFSDGINEYMYSYSSTSNWRNLSEEMLSIEHGSHLKSLLGFYDYLLQGDSSQYMLKEDKVNNREVFVIAFTYPGIALTVEPNGNSERVETINEAIITIDKETYLPVSNKSTSTISSLQDSQIETYNGFEVISEDKADTIFDFSRYIDKLEPINKNTSQVVSISNLGTGRFELKNPGEDILTPFFVIGDKEYNLEGNLLFDKITRKPTIIGKFLLGKEVEISGFIVKSDLAEILWIDKMDYSKLTITNPRTSVVPTDVVLTPTSTPIPTEAEFSGYVYHSEYGSTKQNAIKVSGTLPEGVRQENITRNNFEYIHLESSDMSFQIHEWYKSGFNPATWEPIMIETDYSGNILIHEYAEKLIYYFTKPNNYKTSDCKDNLGNQMASPCADITYSLDTLAEERYMTISCEVKSDPEKALATCNKIMTNLSIAKPE